MINDMELILGKQEKRGGIYLRIYFTKRKKSKERKTKKQNYIHGKRTANHSALSSDIFEVGK